MGARGTTLRLTALMAAGAMALAACDPSIPDSAAGIGEDTSPFNAPPPNGATITGEPLVPAYQVAEVGDSWQNPRPSGLTPAGGATGDTRASSARSQDLAAETAAALSASHSNSGVEPLQASPSNPAPQVVSPSAISDENDFAAVSARQSIESDAERIAQNRAQRVEVAPTALPQRAGNAGPNVVNYALTTSNPVGQRIYSRSGINLQSRNQRNCAEFATGDLAQQAFLETGGPRKDRKILDPDGDGYACDWDPRPYRRALRGG